MKRISSLSIFNTILLVSSTQSYAGFIDYIPFKQKKSEAEIIQKEFAVKANPIITVKDTVGNIEVKAWKQNKVALTATKKAPKPELLSAIDLKIDTTADGLVVLTSTPQENKVSLDYTLLVPEQSHVNLVSTTGNIKIEGINGRICATTDKGNIEIDKACNTVIATSNAHGSITINEARGNTKATCHKGNITIHDAYNSVIAFTQNGNIDVHNACVPATSKINLETKSGLIAVKLPHEVNANVKANATKGTVTSEHLITLKQRTTKLDNSAWKQLKTHVDGILGTGEANIVLTSNKGNVKILEAKTKVV